jgi:hypothetical protein
LYAPQVGMIEIFIGTLVVFLLAMIGVAAGLLAGRPVRGGCLGVRNDERGTRCEGCACTDEPADDGPGKS